MNNVNTTDREGAIEVAPAVLTGCINGSISLSAAQAAFDIDELETTVTVAFDPSVFLGLDEIRDADAARTNMYGDLQVDVQVSGDDLHDEILARVQDSVARLATT